MSALAIQTGETVNEIIPEPLDYFSPVHVNQAFDDRLQDKINPLSGNEATNGGTLKFRVVGTDWFVDLADSYISLKLKLTGTAPNNRDGKIADLRHTQLSVSNLIAHTIFQSIRVKLGNQVITYNDTDYAYKSYLQILFNGNKESHENYFSVAGFMKDDAGQMDAMIDGTDVNNTTNKGLLNRRKEFFSDNNAVGEFIIKPHSGIFFMDKLIPPYLDIEIDLVRNENPNFYLMQAANSNFKIQILEAHFNVQKYRIAVPIVAGLERALATKNESPLHPQKVIKLNLTDGCISTFPISIGTTNYHNDTLFQGKIPSRIIIGLVDSEAYMGSRDKNPFNFQHFKRTNIKLTKNSTEYPEPEEITSFADGTDPKRMHSFHQLLKSINAVYSKEVPVINLKEYTNGYFLTSYNMSPDGNSSLDPHNAAYKPSNIRLELKFGTALPAAVQLIVYYEVFNQITVDFRRNVTVTQQ